MPPINYTEPSENVDAITISIDSTSNNKIVRGQLSTSNNTATIRTNIPGRETSAPATAFPLKLEQIQNVNTKTGIPNDSILKFNKTDGTWEPTLMGTPNVAMSFEFFNSKRWVVQHNMGTTSFSKTLFDSDGNEFVAKTTIIDPDSFVVSLTVAKSGRVDVNFNV